MTGSLKKGLLAVFAAAAMVLVIACFTAPDTYAAEGEMIKAEPVTSTQNSGSIKTKASSTTTDFKIKVSKNGYLMIHPQATTTVNNYYVKVLKSNKKSLFNGYEFLSSTRNSTTFVGLKKGTYYIRISGASPSTYALVYKLYKPSISSRGTSQRSAKKLSKGHTKKGIVYINSYSKKYYYKLVNPKTQRVTLKMNFRLSAGGSSYSGLRIKFYRKGQASRAQKTLAPYNKTTGKIKLYTYGLNYKLQKGTYYIVIYGYKHGNGYYTLKW